MSCLRNHFHYPSKTIYLNSGSVALTPSVVLDRVQKEKEIYELNPTAGLFGAWPRMWQVQKDLAHFFKADPRHLFMRANVTVVMNDFLMALQLPPQSEILISDLEYGAIRQICQYKAQIEGHSVRSMSFFKKGQDPRTVTEASLLESLENSLTDKTRLVMLSHVMTGNGLTLPVEKMAKLLRSKNIFFAVDGAHGAGSCELDLSNTAMDFYGSNLHKWLMGPKGTGFGYVAPRVREFLKPQFAGWTTMEVPPHFAVFGEGDTWTTRWMICSTHNFSDFYGISETVKFWQEMGIEHILNQRQSLTDFTLATVAESTGWDCLSSFGNESLRGPLLAFHLPEKLQKMGFELFSKLQLENQLVISMVQLQGDWALRISPHVYNTKEEIRQAADILSEL